MGAGEDGLFWFRVVVATVAFVGSAWAGPAPRPVVVTDAVQSSVARPIVVPRRGIGVAEVQGPRRSNAGGYSAAPATVGLVIPPPARGAPPTGVSGALTFTVPNTTQAADLYVRVVSSYGDGTYTLVFNYTCPGGTPGVHEIPYDTSEGPICIGAEDPAGPFTLGQYLGTSGTVGIKAAANQAAIDPSISVNVVFYWKTPLGGNLGATDAVGVGVSYPPFYTVWPLDLSTVSAALIPAPEGDPLSMPGPEADTYDADWLHAEFSGGVLGTASNDVNAVLTIEASSASNTSLDLYAWPVGCSVDDDGAPGELVTITPSVTCAGAGSLPMEMGSRLLASPGVDYPAAPFMIGEDGVPVSGMYPENFDKTMGVRYLAVSPTNSPPTSTQFTVTFTVSAAP